MTAPTTDATARTAPARRPRRLGVILVWAALAVIVVLVVLVIAAVNGGDRAGQHLRSPDDTSPAGARALAEVLRDQGIEVSVARTFAEADSAVSVDGGTDTTLLIDDDWWALGPEAYRQLSPLATRLILVLPNDEALDAVAPELGYAGFAGGPVDAACELAAAVRAGTIDAGGDSYLAPADAVRCFPSEGGGFSLVRLETGGRSVTVLGAAELLSNESIAREGNAALALGLLGETRRLVWYQPDADDLAWQPSGTLADRQADWYLPLVVLVALVAVAAAVWRGRRMGAVVVERLPVEVRASETMDGRARLYERGGARDHALDTVRAATTRRMARTLGLPRTATRDEVIAGCAAATGRDPERVRALLHTAPARDDRELVRLSDELLRLEHELGRAVRPQ
ncbi:DUF4350 domain-containing protein [Protaetiibacter larvae]|uniref:DUF4350 domain-containing protein n=1 Tax=Protaetiibacter larvae TaxID=2592654 RepID=A0A5C1Y6U8_9MICO|nr:DUF4350 domain-containing protein [Protaetiibacter larvae]QEO08587.1 DUF4350 domain-containing protein [Protaetiibacter larvae]